MSTDNDNIEWQLKINKKITEIEKNILDSKLTNKKLKWFEITGLITIIAIVIAFTKLFL